MNLGRFGRGGNHASAGAAYLSCGAGRVWFEVEVLEAKGRTEVGFVGTNFRGTTVGSDAVSWSIVEDGKKYHGWCPAPFGPLWPPRIPSLLDGTRKT